MMKTILLISAVSIMNLSALDSGQEWFGFTPYPGARQLCDQFVMGRGSGGPMEIHWLSYATTDAMAKAVAFYQKVKDVEKGSGSVTFRLDKDTTLSVQAATSSDYPKCDSKPKSGEQTVIVVSHAIRR
jgi:hypothetical protein